MMWNWLIKNEGFYVKIFYIFASVVFCFSYVPSNDLKLFSSSVESDRNWREYFQLAT